MKKTARIFALLFSLTAILIAATSCDSREARLKKMIDEERATFTDEYENGLVITDFRLAGDYLVCNMSVADDPDNEIDFATMEFFKNNIKESIGASYVHEYYTNENVQELIDLLIECDKGIKNVFTNTADDSFFTISWTADELSELIESEDTSSTYPFPLDFDDDDDDVEEIFYEDIDDAVESSFDGQFI